jgi:hypothetical protein
MSRPSSISRKAQIIDQDGDEKEPQKKRLIVDEKDV